MEIAVASGDALERRTKGTKLPPKKSYSAPPHLRTSNMLLIQIFIISFAAFAVWRTMSRFREGALGRAALVSWSVFWVAVAVAVALPQSTSWFASFVGVGRGVDAAIYVSVVVLFYLMFRIFLRLEKIEHDITLVVREMGLTKAESGKQKAESGKLK